MAEPLTWQLLKAVETCLQAITKANGYDTDAGQHVTLEPGQLPDTVPLAVAVAIQRIGVPTDAAVSRTHNLVELAVIIKVPATATTAQVVLHRAISDVRRAMANRQTQFLPGLQHPVFDGAEVIPPADGMSFVGAAVRFRSHVPVQ